MAEPYMNKAQQTAKDEASQRKNQAAGAMSSMADALRQTGDQLRDQNQGMYAGYADQAASQIDNLANYIQSQNINDIIDKVEEFGRDQPMLLLGGAFALGMFGARFLKASRPQQNYQNSQYSRSDRNRTTGYGSYATPSYGTGSTTRTGYGADTVSSSRGGYGTGTGTGVGTGTGESVDTRTKTDRPHDRSQYGVGDVTGGTRTGTDEPRGSTDATR